MTEKMKKLPITDYLFLTLGAAIMAIGIGVFLVDAKVVPGGVSGMSMAIYYLTNKAISVGILMWVLNIPLYLWGLKELGNCFAMRTFYAFTLNSFFIDLFTGNSWIPGLHFIRLQDSQTVQGMLHHDFFFLIVLGTVFLGIGLGIIFKFKGTTAGSDIVASIINKKFGTKPGTAIIMIDFFVISFAGIVYEWKDLAGDKTSLTLTLYAFFLLFISSKIIDLIIDGFNYARMAFIISDKYNEIGDAIMNDMVRGATSIKTRGLYRDIEREMVMTVTTNKEVPELTEKIKEIDPDAFIVISDAHEVLGKGFRRRI
jgi:uncharacterized membrane-anchored protein YitT (DUF2179 family)